MTSIRLLFLRIFYLSHISSYWILRSFVSNTVIFSTISATCLRSTKTMQLLTESSLSSWCKNWARSSGVVPSMPCSWRYWIPLFGFLLNLCRPRDTEQTVVNAVSQYQEDRIYFKCATTHTGQCLARWSLSVVWGPQTAQGCQCQTFGCCSCQCQTRQWSRES